MKIEVVPWIHRYSADMDQLYAELTLQEIEQRPTGRKVKCLNGYQDIFTSSMAAPEHPRIKATTESSTISGKMERTRKIKPGQQVVIKADPHMGKTCLAKKITWDWARGIFTTFTIVFCVFLKFVRPGDSIESIIIEQNPVLQELNVTQQRLRYMLETFGNRVLLIMDGLDQHALGQNDDVLKIVMGQKLFQTHIVVTSRPHSTNHIEKYFSTIVRIDGFSRSEAEKFAFNLLQCQEKVDHVLEFAPADLKQGIPLYQFPVLLSVLCILSRNEDIDLSANNVGEIYTRMVKCLYKSFCIRTGIDYTNQGFVGVQRPVGKLAYEMLLFGNCLHRRSQIIREIGGDAFNYGFFSGDEDFRLMGVETADIYVTFLHTTIQVFFGAFYFIQMLNGGESIESLLGSDCKEPIFMMNPLFLHFCLWFSVSGQTYFPFSSGSDVYLSLQRFVKAKSLQSGHKVQNITTVYPALDMTTAHDNITRRFLRELLHEKLPSPEEGSFEMFLSTQGNEERKLASGLFCFSYFNYT